MGKVKAIEEEAGNLKDSMTPDPDYTEYTENLVKLYKGEHMYPNIFIAGASGHGKSTSLRNMPPDKTIVINTERKALPFRGAKKFTKHVMVDSLAMFSATLDKALASNYEVIVIDSFTSLVEFVQEVNIRNADKSGDGSYRAWDNYYYTLNDTIQKCKKSDKIVVFTGIDDIMQDNELKIIKTVGVKGQMKGKVEKEFEVVLWTHTDGKDYFFMTNTDGINKAKSPMGMFDSKLIDNDLNFVIQKVKSYYDEEIA